MMLEMCSVKSELLFLASWKSVLVQVYSGVIWESMDSKK